MQSDTLTKALAPFRHITSRTALAPAYRAIELGPERVKACASFAVLEAHLNIGVSDTVFVDAITFLSIVQSLPPQSDFVLTTSDGSLQWECGPARGKLALMNTVDTPEIAPSVRSRQRHRTTKALATALERGSVSCDNTALGAIGIYGVVMHSNQGVPLICSTDNTTVSSCTTDMPLAGLPETATFPPPGADLLAAVIDDTGTLEFDQQGMVYRSATIDCMVRQVPKLKTDIRDVLTQFGDDNITSAIPQERIRAFLMRAKALTENKSHARVLLGAINGSITLSFAEGTATSDEYILADELDGCPDIVPVALPVDKVARALSYIDSIVLDYIERGVIIFQGGAFRYLVSGPSPNR